MIHRNRKGLLKIDSAIIVIALMIFVYVAIFSLFSYLRFLNFYTGNWDLGINMQELWATTHGKFMYESADYENYLAVSHLEIHPTLVAIPVAYIFFYLPGAATLFILQSLFVSAAIIPLYFISRKLITNRAVVYSILALYLLSVGIVSSLLDDYHWMSLIPLEYFSFFYLVWQKRYYLSVLPFITGIFTLEVFPFLAASVILYLAFSRWGVLALRFWKMSRERDWIVYVVYLVICGLSFLFLRYLQIVFFPALLGNENSVPYITRSFDPFFNLHPGIYGFANGILYWIILYASLGFLPFLHKKHFILAAPWIYETIIVLPNYSGLGNQYAFIGMPPIMIGAIMGIQRIQRVELYRIMTTFRIAAIGSSVFLVSLVPVDYYLGFSVYHALLAAVVFPGIILLFLGFGKISRLTGRNHVHAEVDSNFHRKRAVVGILIVVILFNLLISPVGLQQIENRSVSGGYAFTYGVNPEFSDAKSLAAMVGHNGQVLASNHLFPLVSEDLNAYPIASPGTASETHYYGLPFNKSTPPVYLFIDSSEIASVPAYLVAYLHNSSIYGLLGAVYSNVSFPGDIFLYELNYSGSPVIYYV